ncbi:AP-3 complex subunit sigma-1 isoform X4 [Carcharodon carcharias]|uniref:AP-3 complex subunit sigma-1 isoform X4 n=1 Tax=Carcharodon carcharias TaxID=13397 RepID=UPI001B7DBFA1|nr:AP-3 complex subunit sigma-1 isoform X4 [Carcharodon carcharias]
MFPVDSVPPTPCPFVRSCCGEIPLRFPLVSRCFGKKSSSAVIMIKAILIFNNHGKPRLSKFYERYSEDTQQQIIRETFHLVSRRDENVCNFLEGGMLIGGADNKLIYRHYATLYFVFCVDSSESELGILDLIQVFVETLDKCFENVCELDLIFHVDKAGLAGAPARAVSAVKNMNLPEMPRNINIGDISIKVPNLPSFK